MRRNSANQGRHIRDGAMGRAFAQARREDRDLCRGGPEARQPLISFRSKARSMNQTRAIINVSTEPPKNMPRR